MADIPLSGLNAITNLESTDLIAVSKDNGDTTFTSKKITVLNFNMVAGIRYYGTLASDPSSPTPSDGDEYYNTSLNKKMSFDGSRSKWLSVETVTMYFGRNGNTGSGVYFRTINGLAYSATNGFYTPWKCTICGMGYTRNDTDAAAFTVTDDGANTAASLASLSTSGSETSYDVNVVAGSVLGVINSGANATSGVNGWVFIRWRA